MIPTVALVAALLKCRVENVIHVNMDIGESCLEKGVRNAYVIPWELSTLTVTM